MIIATENQNWKGSFKSMLILEKNKEEYANLQIK